LTISFVLNLFIRFSRFHNQLVPLSDADNFRNLGSQFLLSLKSFLMGYWMHRSYQIFSVIAMFMASQVIAAQHICITIVSVFHVVPISLSMAFSVLVGNMVGARRIREARAYVKMGIGCGVVWGVACSLTMLIFR
jgi:MATE family multidrug resistance protein